MRTMNEELQRIYDKYKHMDQLLTDPLFDDDELDPPSKMLRAMWKDIKAAVQKKGEVEKCQP